MVFDANVEAGGTNDGHESHVTAHKERTVSDEAQ